MQNIDVKSVVLADTEGVHALNEDLPLDAPVFFLPVITTEYSIN